MSEIKAADSIDWRKILLAYVEHVAYFEGVDCLTRGYIGEDGIEGLTRSECAALLDAVAEGKRPECSAELRERAHKLRNAP